MKKIYLYILTALLFAACRTCVYADDIEIDPPEIIGDYVTIGGTIKANSKATIYIGKHGVQDDDITNFEAKLNASEGMTDEEITIFLSENIEFIDQTVSDEHGNFLFRFRITPVSALVSGPFYCIIADDDNYKMDVIDYTYISDIEKLIIDKNSLRLEYDEDTVEIITLPVKGEYFFSDISWSSSNRSVVSIDSAGNTARVLRQKYDKSPTVLTATLTYNNETETKEFIVDVPTKIDLLLKRFNGLRYTEYNDVITDTENFSLLKLSGNSYYRIFSGLSATDKESVYKLLVLAAKETPFKALNEFLQAFDIAVANIEEKLESRTKSSANSKSLVGSGALTIITEPESSEQTEIKIAPTDNIIQFTDISDVEWAKEGIEKLGFLGAVSGIGNGEFRPNDHVTREEFIKILVISFGIAEEYSDCGFTDVLKNEWYFSYIAGAKKAGITNGKSDARFGVGEEITRQDMAVLAYRTALYANVMLTGNGQSSDFLDTNAIADYAIDCIHAMKQAGILNGDEENRFNPNEASTRAEAVKVIYELLKFMAD